MCVQPCDPRRENFFPFPNSFCHLHTCRGAEEAHRALPNEALYGVLRILGLINPAYLHKVGSFSFPKTRFSGSDERSSTCKTCCVQMWQTCICADMLTNMCGHVAFSCCDMFRSRHVKQTSAEDGTKPSTSLRGCMQVCVCLVCGIRAPN